MYTCIWTNQRGENVSELYRQIYELSSARIYVQGVYTYLHTIVYAYFDVHNGVGTY